ncbi:kinase-like domain-containing protein [Syncephalis plumigaleata]|nr:kinase-like domain-containing protein [Syncephalis plumigaleata]
MQTTFMQLSTLLAILSLATMPWLTQSVSVQSLSHHHINAAAATTSTTSITNTLAKRSWLSKKVFDTLPVHTVEEIKQCVLAQKNAQNTPRVEDRIGTGNCGTVVTIRENGQITALKVPLNPNEAYQMSHIIKVLRAQPGGTVFPQTYPTVMTTYGPGMRMEYFEGAQDLDVYLKNIKSTIHPNEFQTRVKRLFSQVIRGVELLHTNNYVHGSLKPANFIVARNAQTGQADAKIIDFGWTRQAKWGSKSTYYYRYLGTLNFAPPEAKVKSWILRIDPQRAEIWTVGAAFYYSITGKNISYNGNSKVPNLQDIKDESLRQVFNCMLNADPAARCSAVQIAKLPYFTT